MVAGGCHFDDGNRFEGGVDDTVDAGVNGGGRDGLWLGERKCWPWQDAVAGGGGGGFLGFFR